MSVKNFSPVGHTLDAIALLGGGIVKTLKVFKQSYKRGIAQKAFSDKEFLGCYRDECGLLREIATDNPVVKKYDVETGDLILEGGEHTRTNLSQERRLSDLLKSKTDPLVTALRINDRKIKINNNIGYGIIYEDIHTKDRYVLVEYRLHKFYKDINTMKLIRPSDGEIKRNKAFVDNDLNHYNSSVLLKNLIKEHNCLYSSDAYKYLDSNVEIDTSDNIDFFIHNKPRSEENEWKKRKG